MRTGAPVQRCPGSGPSQHSVLQHAPGAGAPAADEADTGCPSAVHNTSRPRAVGRLWSVERVRGPRAPPAAGLGRRAERSTILDDVAAAAAAADCHGARAPWRTGALSWCARPDRHGGAQLKLVRWTGWSCSVRSPRSAYCWMRSQVLRQAGRQAGRQVTERDSRLPTA